MKINPIRGFGQFPKPNKGVVTIMALATLSIGGAKLITRRENKK